MTLRGWIEDDLPDLGGDDHERGEAWVSNGGDGGPTARRW
jgi:hypothetical protein